MCAVLNHVCLQETVSRLVDWLIVILREMTLLHNLVQLAWVSPLLTSWMGATSVCVYACVCVCMYVCMCVCLCVCLYVHVCMYVCMYVCTYVCMYVCMCVCMCIQLTIKIFHYYKQQTLIMSSLHLSDLIHMCTKMVTVISQDHHVSNEPWLPFLRMTLVHVVRGKAHALPFKAPIVACTCSDFTW